MTKRHCVGIFLFYWIQIVFFWADQTLSGPTELPIWLVNMSHTDSKVLITLRCFKFLKIFMPIDMYLRKTKYMIMMSRKPSPYILNSWSGNRAFGQGHKEISKLFICFSLPFLLLYLKHAQKRLHIEAYI
jgi:hypothetical protein